MLDFDKQYEVVSAKLQDLEAQLGQPETIANPKLLARLTKAYRRLERLAQRFAERQKAARRAAEAKELLHGADEDMAELARQEYEESSEAIQKLEREIQLLLVPPDPNDERNTILEIRAGTGGEEAALFAADLARMYQRYCESRSWRMSLISATESGLRGFKEAIFSIEGENVYSHLKHEMGTHRVQRVPVTEASGRIHTSAVTVAVLPEAQEVDVAIRPEELRIDTFHSTGPGGQSVNTTDSAVRITHLPTGMVVSCQDEKSQLKNRTKALKVLRARLLDAEQRRVREERASERAKQIGTGDRSQRIRTYNFPENRVTDHRVNFRSKSLAQILEGAIDPLIEALMAAEQERRLGEVAEMADV